MFYLVLKVLLIHTYTVNVVLPSPESILIHKHLDLISLVINTFLKHKHTVNVVYLDLISLLIHTYTVNVVLPGPESTPNTHIHS